MTVGMSSARFQLEKMGHLLRRDIRTDPDPRVDGFIPDTWQVILYKVVTFFAWMLIRYFLVYSKVSVIFSRAFAKKIISTKKFLNTIKMFH